MKFGPIDTKKYVVSDFETYFDKDYTLRKMRNEEYILDSRFKVHGLAVAFPSGKTDFLVGKEIEAFKRAYKGFTFVNHKMTFDGLIWKLRYDFSPIFLVDTLYMANAIFGPAEVSGGNDLASVAQRLGLPAKGSILSFEGKRDLTREEAATLKIYGVNDADITNKAFLKMLPMFSRPEFEFWLMDHTLKLYLNHPLDVDAKVAKGAIGKVEANVAGKIKTMPKISFTFNYVKKYKRKAGTHIENLSKKLLVTGEVLSSNKQFGQALVAILKETKTPVPMKRGKNAMIPALAKNDEGFLALLTSKSKAVRTVVAARLSVKSASTQIARLRTLLLVSSLGGFRIYLNYWGAGTGRWSGGSGLNPQNFPNPTKSPDEFEREVAALIRAAVTPGKGSVFVATDAANIEARVLAWWAGELELVRQFGEGLDVYSSFASEAFGEEVRKPKDGDAPAKAKRFKLLRDVGKSTVLGLGFGMGNTPQPGQKYGKFEMNLRANVNLAPLFESGELNTKRIDDLLTKYRDKYKLIVALWSRTEAAFFSALEGGKRMVNGVLFEPYTNTEKKRGVIVTLPSGRMIRYPDVRLGEAGQGRKRKQWVYGYGKGKKIYGSLLVENIVQAKARDILAEGVWAMDQLGYHVSYHVHDSIVAKTKKKNAKKCLADCISVLSEAPEWGKGMMLGAEGTIEEVFA